MAHVLQVVAGSDTITLTSGSWLLRSYEPATPRPSNAGVGAARMPVTYYDVTETIELTADAGSKTANQALVRALELLMVRASERGRLGGGDRVYLHFQIDGDSEVFRSEILQGRVDVVGNAMATWYSLLPDVRLHITRRYYWEETSETGVSMTSTDTAVANTTAAITNTVPESWVQIAASQVDGSLPTPAKITVTKTDADDDYVFSLTVLNNWYDDASTYDAYMWGVEADGGASFSDTGGVSDGAAYRFPLSAAQLSDLRGKFARVLVQLGSNNITEDDEIWQLAVEQQIGAAFHVTARGPRIAPYYNSATGSNKFHDFGSVPIPPGGDISAPGGTHLSLRLTTVETPIALTCQYILIVPACSEVKVESVLTEAGFALAPAQNDQIVINGIEDRCVFYDSSANTWHPLTATRGGPLLLFPGRTQRLYFAWEDQDADGTITMNVNVSYRKRRLTV